MLIFPKRNLVDLAGDIGGSDPLLVGPDSHPHWFVTSAFTSSRLPLTHLQERRLSDVYRVLSADRAKTFASIEFGGANAGRTVRGLALVGHTLSPGAKARVTVASAETAGEATYPLRQEKPTSLEANSGYSSPSVNSVDDDPDDPGADLLAPSTATSTTDVRLGFGTPASGTDLLSGANLQQFRVLVGLDDGTGVAQADSGDSATVEIELWESGSLVSALETAWSLTAAAVDGGEARSFFFDATLLSNAEGANVELRIRCVPDGGSTLTGTLMAAMWYADLDDYDYDSGWLDVYPSAAEDVDLWPFGRNFVHVLDTPLVLDSTVQVLEVRFWDPSNVAGFVDLGRLIVGDGVVPAMSFSLGQPLNVDDPSPGAHSIGGDYFADNRRRRRGWKFRLPGLARAGAHELLDLFARAGNHGEVVVVPSSSDPDVYGYEAVYGRILGRPSVIPLTPNALGIWTSRFSVEEINVQLLSEQIAGTESAIVGALLSESGSPLLTEGDSPILT